MRSLALLLSCVAVLVAGCSKEPESAPVAATPKPAVETPVDHDEHSYAEPRKVAIDDLALDIAVDFDAKTIGGTA
ncbi:MAG: aminopeptidase, partial [Stenotrophomonas acidaminiphila]